ncbi:MAG: AIR synthase-related protein, partial [Pseudomonadota bacterium]
SGELGGAALGLARPDIAAAARRLEEPEPRVALGERLRGLASAAIDVSDGFAQDLGHVLEASGVGAVVEYELLPKAPELKALGDRRLEQRCVLSGGDDYELVFTAPGAQRGAVAALAQALGLALTRVGLAEKGNPELKLLGPGRRRMKVARGFDHFAP